MKKKTLDDTQITVGWRRKLVAGVLLLIPAALIGRAFDLQVLEREFLIKQAQARHQRTLPTNAYRGRILDRNGSPLAVSTPIWSVWTDPTGLPESAEQRQVQLQRLAQTLGRKPEDLLQRIESSPSPEFAYLARGLEPQVSEKIRSLGIPGIYLQREYRRYYPLGEVVSQLVGFTDIDDKGQEGIERIYDTALSAQPGKSLVLRDRYGRAFREIEELVPARNGQDIHLSIDQQVQFLTYRAIKTGVERHRALSGSAVVMDAQTGEVLAMTSFPSFNPNDVKQRRGAAARNRALVDSFEPGSTIKPFTVVTALQSGQYSAGTVVNTSPGYMRINEYRIRDAINYGRLDFRGILQKSSNVGMSKVALSLSRADVWSTLDQFGFGHETGVSFPGEQSGLLRFYTDWYKADHAAVSYGYGLSVTLTQLARAYSALANGGRLPQVSLLRQPQAQGYEVVPKNVAQSVASMLRAVVERGGTGRAAAVEGYVVAGKTGTTRKASRTGYDEENYYAQFIGFVPATRPRLVIGVVIDQPSAGDIGGGKVAAPVFADIAAGALRSLGIPPDDPSSMRVASRGAP